MQRVASCAAIHQGVLVVHPCRTSTCWNNDHTRLIFKVCVCVCVGGGGLYHNHTIIKYYITVQALH